MCLAAADAQWRQTSMLLNCLPLYASENSAACAGSRNFITTIERFGAESLGSTRAHEHRGRAEMKRGRSSPDHPQVGDTIRCWRNKREEVRGVHPRGNSQDGKRYVVRVNVLL